MLRLARSSCWFIGPAAFIANGASSPRRRRGQRNATSQDIVAAVRLLVRIASDDLIAGILNRNKLTTGNGNRWTRERVTALRSHHKIPVHRPPQDGNIQWSAT